MPAVTPPQLNPKFSTVECQNWYTSNAWAYLEGGCGGRGPPIENFFVPFKYSLSWFLPNTCTICVE